MYHKYHDHADTDRRATFLTRTYTHQLGAILGFTVEAFLFSSGLAEPIARAMLRELALCARRVHARQLARVASGDGRELAGIAVSRTGRFRRRPRRSFSSRCSTSQMPTRRALSKAPPWSRSWGS